jgi:hypothetical protein
LKIFDETRVYHVKDTNGGANRWVYAINKFLDVQKSYLKTKMGDDFVFKSIV